MMDDVPIEPHPNDPNEWDVVESIKVFSRLIDVMKGIRSKTPRLTTTEGGHPINQALAIIDDCRQAAILAYGKAMWQDAHNMKEEIDGKSQL